MLKRFILEHFISQELRKPNHAETEIFLIVNKQNENLIQDHLLSMPHKTDTLCILSPSRECTHLHCAADNTDV